MLVAVDEQHFKFEVCWGEKGEGGRGEEKEEREGRKKVELHCPAAGIRPLAIRPRKSGAKNWGTCKLNTFALKF